MERTLDHIHPPQAEVFRIGWHDDPLQPPSWELASANGTFGNRFDDPGAADGRPAADRFRCLYLASTPEAAFAETLAGKRVPIDVLATLAAIEDDEPASAVLAGAAVDLTDPARPRGLVTAEWRARHRIGRTTLHPALRFADVATFASQRYLRHALAPIAQRLGIADVDSSTLLNPTERAFTQACARHIYELHEAGVPHFAGIRYLSRLDPLAWECWAVFVDRLRHTPSDPEPIAPDNAALWSIAHEFELTIEGPHGVLLRP